MKRSSSNKGNEAEDKARLWLEQQGLTHHLSNWHCRLGEIDLIMKEGDTWVFVEVRYRKSSFFGGPLASVTPAKQKKLAAAAGIWLSRQPQKNLHCRFDVLGISPNANGSLHYQWIQHAFMAS